MTSSKKGFGLKYVIAWFAALVFLTVLSLTYYKFSPHTAALAMSDWRAGRIIDDEIFYNNSSMSEGDIQNWLNAYLSCDTDGVKTSEWSGGTDYNGDGRISRAEWAKAVYGYTGKFVCLRDYYENPNTFQNNLQTGVIPSGAISAAAIIKRAADTYHVSPKVLLVKLRKESPGPLTADEWPLPSQFDAAIGYACPDPPPGQPVVCDPAYKGFYKQITTGAWQINNYKVNYQSFRYKPFQSNFIYYNPDTNCGGSNVYVENYATAGLYNYTPYQPNQGALANYPGEAPCGAYGNRNFWAFYDEWFGSPYGGDPVSTQLRLTVPLTLSPQIPVPGQPTTISYTVKNFSTNAITSRYSLVQCRLDFATNCDSPWSSSVTLQAGESRSFTTSITIPRGGSYKISAYFLADSNIWYRYGSDVPDGNTLALEIPDLRLTSSINLSPENAIIGQRTVVRLSLVNYGTRAVSLETSVIQCRYNITSNCDSNYGGALIIQPGQQMTFSYAYTPRSETQILIPYYRVGGVWYKYNPGSPNTRTVNIPNMRLTSAITITPAQPIPGEPTTISYTVKNFGGQSVSYQDSVLQCRFNAYTNCDDAYAGPLVIAAGESKTFTLSFIPDRAGSYRFVPYFKYNNLWYMYVGDSFANNLSLEVAPYSSDLRLTENINVSPIQPLPGQTMTISYSVKNYGVKVAYYQDGVLQCRFNSLTNCDGPYLGRISIQPGETRTFSITRQARSGSYTFSPYVLQNDSWRKYQSGLASANSATLVVDTYTPDLRLISPISLNPSTPLSSQSTTATFTVKNFGTKSVYYQTAVLQCRANSIINCDSGYEAPLALQAGESMTFDQSFIAKDGQHVLIPYYLYDGVWRQYSPGTQSSNSLMFTN